mmetsp:Transcript_22361/g.53212  ORF Transcript_22361/g.53212 Transcript_22361/m.53212 type:complete len:206 (+) Transcript_22361:72-689(+)
MVSSHCFDNHVPGNFARRTPSIVNLVSEIEDEMFSSRIEGTKDGIDWMEKYFDFDIETDSDSDSESESVVTDISDNDYDDSSCDESECSIARPRQLKNGYLLHEGQETRPLFVEFNRMMQNYYPDDFDDENASVTSLDSLNNARKRGMTEWYKKRPPKASLHSVVGDDTSSQPRILDLCKNDKISNLQRHEEFYYEESDYCIRLK